MKLWLLIVSASCSVVADPQSVDNKHDDLTVNILKYFPSHVRTYDGKYNNLHYPLWGSAQTPFVRDIPAQYADGKDVPIDYVNARYVSNHVSSQKKSKENTHCGSDWIWAFGQFVDHDTDETMKGDESMDIQVPPGDHQFDPDYTSDKKIPFTRSKFTYVNDVRNQVNEVSAYLDGSQIYGSEHERAEWLHAEDWKVSGKMKMSPGDNLPINHGELPNAPDASANWFVAGDVRVNEQLILTSLHMLFLREHNRLADQIKALHPQYSGTTIFQMAKALVVAQLQVITYNDWLPLILGPYALPAYKGYNPHVNAGITSLHSTVAFRFGHSMLPKHLHCINAYGEDIGHVNLQELFFMGPKKYIKADIDCYLRGLAFSKHQKLDMEIVDEARLHLFKEQTKNKVGLDLMALNLQRGKDHGVPVYFQVRKHLYLPIKSWKDISSDRKVIKHLKRAYKSIHDIDSLVGMLAEDHVQGAMVGPTVKKILTKQFTSLRNGDRFWYQYYFKNRRLVKWLESQTLAKIIRRNSEVKGNQIPDNVFLVPGCYEDSYSNYKYDYKL